VYLFGSSASSWHVGIEKPVYLYSIVHAILR
jgi:hypothetical protein